ncbi:MAG: chemotaxis protein CheW [Pseudomonadota bacterium]
MTKDSLANPPGSRAPLDGEAVRLSLARAEQNLSQGPMSSAEEKRAVLKARARALAREAPTDQAAHLYLEVLLFRLASEIYGIESGFVRETHHLKNFTPLPGTPTFVLGIVNLRGGIISVVDLKKFFNLPEKGIGELNKVIVIRDQRMEFGILADAIVDVRAIALADINPVPPTVTGIGAEYLKGVTGDQVIIIDAQRILEDEKIIVLQEAD